MSIRSNHITWPQIPEDIIRSNYFICTEVSRRIPDKILLNSLRNRLTATNPVNRLFSNCGPRTTSGPRVLPLWSF